jgi:hypothetical protein
MSNQQGPKSYDNRQGGGAPPPPPPDDYYSGGGGDDYYQNKPSDYAYNDAYSAPGVASIPAYQTVQNMQVQPRLGANVGMSMQMVPQQQQPMMVVQQPVQQAVGLVQQQQVVGQQIQMVPVQRQVQQVQMVPVQRMRMVQVQQPVQRQVCQKLDSRNYMLISERKLKSELVYHTTGHTGC